jgi:hypothetical protein
MSAAKFLNSEHELFETALTDAMHLIHSQVPAAMERATVRDIASRWLLEKIRLGERDRSKLAQGTKQCLEQAFKSQTQEPARSVTNGASKLKR